jgi:hypothetical protein
MNTQTPVYSEIDGFPLVDGIPVFPIYGAASGIHTSADVISAQTLVSQTADELSLDELWEEFTAILDFWNKERTSLTDLLSFKTTVAGEAVVQSIEADSFEKATEFGVAMAQGVPLEAAVLGYDRFDWDKRSAFTWKFLRDSSAEQVRTVFQSILHADTRLVTGRILRRILDPAPSHNEAGWDVVGLWNGDGTVPPPFGFITFTGTETMYIASGATTLDSADIEDAVKKVQSHGYGLAEGAGGQMLIIANPVEAQLIRSWRAGQESRARGPKCLYDFVLSSVSPPHFSADTLVGERVSGEWNGVRVQGNYDVSYLIESGVMPPGYVICAASQGKNATGNVCGLREHPDPAQQGLRQIAGTGPYPVVDSHSARCFGVGVRHRGAAAVIQVTTNPTYTPPPAALIPI